MNQSLNLKKIIMINDPKQTTQADIEAVSKAFNIPKESIERLLRKQTIKKKATNGVDKKKRQNKPESIQAYVQPHKLLEFSEFDTSYINAENTEAEMEVIKMFIPSCVSPNQTKTLYQICPETYVDLRNAILLKWIELCRDFNDIREVRALTTKGTVAADLAYQKYLKLY